MMRFILYMILSLAAVVAAAVWFSDRPGLVAIQWQGWLIEMSVGRFVLAAAILFVLASVILGVFRLVGHAPGRIREGRRTSRRERGYRALTHGMVAVAAGDAAEAQRQARRADVLLNEPPLTMLLSAQAAQLSGDEAAAKRYFTDMLSRPETAFLGIRGLLMQAQREHDRPAALRYAERAYELQPRTPWVLTTMFDLQVKEGRWRAALATLDEAVKRKAVTAEAARDRRAAVLLGCSGEAEAAGDPSEALRFARRASTLAPDYLPAVLRTVELLARSGKARPAARMIHNAWTRTPHPELARIYARLGGAEDALKRVRRFERLLSFNPASAESHIALAEAALAAELWGEARNHLDKAAGDDPSARVCRLMADLEERERADQAAVRKWLRRAAAAVPDPAWVCAECGVAWEDWTPACGSCDALGALHWGAPARPRATALGLSIAADPDSDIDPRIKPEYDDEIEAELEAEYLDGDVNGDSSRSAGANDGIPSAGPHGPGKPRP